MFKACIGLNCARQIDWIDRRNCQLNAVPEDIFRHEATLEELLLDTNMIQELPSKMFRLTNLRKLTLSENDLGRIPHGIANLTRLYELDVSKNAIEEIPSNIQFCRSLSVLDISCNPLLRIPDFLSSVQSLTHLYLNDTALPALPRGIGNLKNLLVLEARENLLRKLPMSIGELGNLQRLDLGNNEIEELPPTVGQLEYLSELWLDSNSLSTLPETFCRLVNLTVLDVTKNKLERFPTHFSHLVSLCDLHASENCIEALPEDFGCLRSLIQIKLDLNHLVNLPDSIGNLQNATEIFLFDNMLECIPPSLFNIPTLQMLNLDRNHLMEIPSTVSNCKSLHVLSLRENDLVYLPEEIGSLENLRVLDVVGNRLPYLPLSVSNLNLDALWVRGSQLQPLISLQPHSDPDNSEKKVLMCQYLPQRGPYNSECDIPDMTSDYEYSEDSWPKERSSTLPSRTTKLSVAFEPNTAGLPPEDLGNKLVRFPTPFRKDLKNKRKKPKLNARPTNTVFKKGSLDDLTVHAVTELPDVVVGSEVNASKPPSAVVADTAPVQIKRNGGTSDSLQIRDLQGEWEVRGPSPLLKSTAVRNLSEGFIAEGQTEEEPVDQPVENTHPPTHSRLQTVEVTVDLKKEPGRSLGFSIAGGRGSTPAYEDVDESIFITKITSRGLADRDGRLRLGDKVLSVNGENMLDATHSQAVAALKSSHEFCTLTISREVLVVLPEGMVLDDDEEDSQESSHHRETSEGYATPTEDGYVPTLEPVHQSSPPRTEKRGEAAGEERQPHRAQRLSDDLHMDQNSEHNILEEGLDECFPTAQTQKEKGSQFEPYVNLEIAQTILDEPSPQQEEEEEEEAKGVAGDQTDNDGITEASEFEEELVVLDRKIENLGLSIVGGVDQTCHVFGRGKPGIYVSKVSDGGAAAATGKIRLGDRLLKVNGYLVENATHDEVVDCLVSQTGDIELLVRHEPQPEGLEEVVLHKGDLGKLGISIKGGAKGSLGNPLDPEDEGIFISKITKGGAAEHDGRLHVGNRILEAGGQSLLGASHVEAVRILRNAGESLKLVVCHGYNPTDLPANSDFAEHKQMSGSVDALQDVLDKEKKNQIPVKRTQSSFSAIVKGKDGDLGHVIGELTRFREEASAIFSSSNEVEQLVENMEKEKNEKELTSELEPKLDATKVEEDAQVLESALEIQVVPTEEALKQLDESVNEMDEITQDMDEPTSEEIEEKQQTVYLRYRKESAEEEAQLRHEKQEEVKSIISEVLSEMSFEDIERHKSLGSEESSRASLHSFDDVPPAREGGEEDKNNECKGDVCDSSHGCDGDGNCSPAVNIVRNMEPRAKSLSSLMIELPERPLSAMDRRRPGDLLPPQSLVFLLNPEKLSFKERVALYQSRVDASSRERELNQAGLRRSCSSLLSPHTKPPSPFSFSKGRTSVDNTDIHQYVISVPKQHRNSSGNLLMSTSIDLLDTSKPGIQQSHFSPEVPSEPAAPNRSWSEKQGERRVSFTSDPGLTDSNNSLASEDPAPSPSLTDSDYKLNETGSSRSPVVEASRGQSWRELQTVAMQNGLKEVEMPVQEC